jgi:pyruvate ferredoxin oxidoreductase alpha subunit
MSIRERLSGNEAIAHAMKQINPDVMGAYPITPSTEIPQYFSSYVDNGEVDTEFIAVESEHSAMSTCIGAQAAGCRAISATSSCGLIYMAEMLYVAASDRLPITLAVSCRALSGPININNDHSDVMAVRDAGWLILFAETNQEAYDNYLQAMRIGEAVSLPIMICQDGFITSHAIENIELEESEQVREFVGEYHPKHYLLNPSEQIAVGPYSTPVYYIETKRQQAQAMLDAKAVIRQVADEFAAWTGRQYDLIEQVEMEDAELAIILMGSSAGTAREAIAQLRAQGKKVGMIKIRSFRPFPAAEIAQALQHVKAFAAMDKDDSFNAHCGPIFAEVCAGLYAAGICAPKGISYIYGLGGRDVRVDSIANVYADLEHIAQTGDIGQTYRYLDVRENEQESGGGADAV